MMPLAPTKPDAGRLAGEIKAMIAASGPITVERYMSLCLGHPQHGYYTTRDPFGSEGDFVTAPEISQMFGELIGVWAAAVWSAMEGPAPLRLVEFGPGRGTLMADALRAAKALPEFKDALDVHLVETSPALRARQRAVLQDEAVTWHDTATSLPDGPAILIANEFFDALPVRQFVRVKEGWRERCVGLNEAGDLAFGLHPYPFSHPGLSTFSQADVEAASEGSVFEVCPQALEMIASLGRRLVGQGGGLLLIDYGSAKPVLSSTLQGVKRHTFVDPLIQPGQADLTAHVNFSALAAQAAHVGAQVHGPVLQADFLEEMGLSLRAETLKANATSPQADAIDAAVQRLTDRSPTGMGALFKVLAISHPSLSPPGFGHQAS